MDRQVDDDDDDDDNDDGDVVGACTVGSVANKRLVMGRKNELHWQWAPIRKSSFARRMMNANGLTLSVFSRPQFIPFT